MPPGSETSGSRRLPQKIVKRPHSVGNRVSFVTRVIPRSAKSTSDAASSIRAPLIAINNVVVEDLDLDLNFDAITIPSTSTSRYGTSGRTATTNRSTSSPRSYSSSYSSPLSQQTPNFINEEYLMHLMEDVLGQETRLNMDNIFGENIYGTDFYVLVKRSTSISFIQSNQQSQQDFYTNGGGGGAAGVSQEYNRLCQIFHIDGCEDDESTDETPSFGSEISSKNTQPTTTAVDRPLLPKYCWLEGDSLWDNENGNEILWGKSYIDPFIDHFDNSHRSPVLLPNEVPVPDDSVLDLSMKKNATNNDNQVILDALASDRYAKSQSTGRSQIPTLTTSSSTKSRMRSPKPNRENQLTIEEIDLYLDYPLKYREVSLENHGILITPTKAEAAGKLLVFEAVEMPSCETTTTTTATSESSDCLFGWAYKKLMEFCCGRSSSAVSSKVRAKVNKTYFVKWEKPPPLSGQMGAFTELRTCRSSTF